MRNVIYKTVIRDSEDEYFSGVTLGKNDTIQISANHEVTVGTYLKKFGKEGVIDLLSSFNLEDDILEEYHIHLQTPAEKAKREREMLVKENAELKSGVKNSINVSAPQEGVFETTATEIVDDDYMSLDVYEEDYINNVLYDSEDDPVDSSFYNPSDAGWETHPFGGVPVGNVRKPIF